MAPLTTLRSDHRQAAHEIIICAAGVASTTDSTHQLHAVPSSSVLYSAGQSSTGSTAPCVSHARSMYEPTYVHMHLSPSSDVNVRMYILYIQPHIRMYVLVFVIHTLTNCLYISNLHIK